MGATRPWLRVIHHESNRGYGGALISGFQAARHDWIFYTDGDAQYDAKEAALLVPLANNGVDVVQGYKIGRGDPMYRKVIGRSYHHVVKRLFRLPVRDTDCDFRLFRRQLIIDQPLTSTSGVICVEMMRNFSQAGATFVRDACAPLLPPVAVDRSSSACRRSPAARANCCRCGIEWWSDVRDEDFENLHHLEDTYWWFVGMRDVQAALLDPVIAAARPQLHPERDRVHPRPRLRNRRQPHVASPVQRRHWHRWSRRRRAGSAVLPLPW